jgi:DNA-binding IclR family transcriptional regulator
LGQFFTLGGRKIPYTNKKKSAGSALKKALQVLEAIIDQPQAVGLPDMADRLSMSRQTVHRVLQQLEDNGLVVRDPSRDRFAIGPRFSKLALDALQSSNNGAPIRATIQQVVDEIRETCNVGVLEGRNFVYLERVETSRTPRIYLETGSQLPAHVTSGGKVLLAFLPDGARKRLINTMDFKQFTKHTITDRSELLTEAEKNRKRGYATAFQEYADGIIGIGVPILSSDGHPLAALALHAPIQRIAKKDVPDYASKLQVCAARLAKIWDMVD